MKSGSILFVLLMLVVVAGAEAAEVQSDASVTSNETEAASEMRSGKSGFKSDPGFAGPGSTTSQLKEDDEIKDPLFRLPWFHELFQPWFDWKAELKKKTGLQLGLAYTSLYQGTADYDDAGAGLFRISGSWALVNRESKNTGSLVFSVDHRHGYTALTPGAYDGLGAGYHGITGPLFNDLGLIMGDFNWQQKLLDGKAGLVVGRYDPNDFFDVLGSANPWTSFQNLAILFNPSIALPDWSYGIGGGSWFDDRYYLKAAVNDANGTSSHLGFFSEGAELFITAEVGWSPSSVERYLKNVHLMGWHVDDASRANLSESHGIAVGGNWTWNETWMLFSKIGWSEGTAPLYNKSVTVGGMYHIARRSDLLGLGLNWGEPSTPGLRDQYTGELFYRLQFSENLALTPSIQYIKDPALNENEDHLWAFGVRARLVM